MADTQKKIIHSLDNHFGIPYTFSLSRKKKRKRKLISSHYAISMPRFHTF